MKIQFVAGIMGNNFDKFLLLMWKNFLIQWRYPIQTVIEIFAPVLLASLMVVIRSLLYPEMHAASFYLPYDNCIANKSFIKPIIAWSPKNEILKAVMDSTIKSINSKNNVTSFRHLAFENSQNMETYLSNEFNIALTLGGIQFDDSLKGLNKLPSNMDVIFRFPAELRGTTFADQLISKAGMWNTQSLFRLYQIPGPRNRKSNVGGDPNYYEQGFLMLQQELSFSIIQQFKIEVKGTEFDSESVPIQMQRFPYPKYTEDRLLTALQTIVGLIFMLSFVYTCISTVKVITTEKEKQLKESMKIMGLPNWLHWTAWFVKTFLILLITIIIMVILMKASWYPGTQYTIFTFSNLFVIFIFLICYISATITLCFAISVFFSKANTAATIAGLIWFLTYFPYMLFYESYGTMSLTQKLLASLLSNTAMAYGLQLMLIFEGNEEGIQWNNVWSTTTPDDTLTLGYLMLMLIVDTFLYLLIALYFETVFPGEYGVPQPWYFPVTSSYWRGTLHHLEMENHTQHSIINEFYELEPDHLNAGIQIQNLRKVFSKKVAVQNLTLNMYKDQITVLLGHNGAGKTTIMSMLTGMFPPTSGTAIIGGYDIKTDIARVRQSLGLCPQHNILLDELTVKEHLYFFCRLKGLNKMETSKQIDKYICLLDLEEKANALSSTLSGGMKRKLSVGIALCGDSQVVMLDEPTAGMDPAARRTLWDLLQSQKKGRTILLSTHFMDEADLLGDRIAIMAGGELQCCGSSFFLKKKYGAGYHLVMDTVQQCNVDAVTALLQKYISNIQVESNIGTELTYSLNEHQSGVFEQMLRDLESHINELGIASYGISLTTMEEVFMKVGSDHRQDTKLEGNIILPIEEPTHQNCNINFSNQNGSNEIVSFGENMENQSHLLMGWKLWINQIMAMSMKRSLSVLRSWILFLIQICIPITYLTLTILFLKGRGAYNNLPSLKINLDSYHSPITTLTRYQNNAYSESYIQMLERDNKQVINWEGKNFSMKMIEETERNTAAVRVHYITGATFRKDNSVIAWYNNEPFHSAPLSLQLVMNSILQSELSSPDYRIQFYNYPLPFTSKTQFSKILNGNNMGFQIAFNIGFSMAFVSAFYLMFYVRERISKAKHLQFLSGVGVLSFWIPSYIIDLLTFTFTSFCVVVTVVIFQEDGFKTAADIGRLFSILTIFGFSMLPMMYLASYLFDVPSTGFTRITFVNIITGVAIFMVVQVLGGIPDVKYVADIMNWVFLIIPHYSLSSGIQNMNLLYSIHNICDTITENCVHPNIPQFHNLTIPLPICKLVICYIREQCCTTTNNYYDLENPGIGKQMIFSSCAGILFIGIHLLIEYRIIDKIQTVIRNKYSRSSNLEIVDEDDDVSFEKNKIRDFTREDLKNCSLVMKNVSKYYGDFLAVNNICLKVDKYDCFGLLGVNGAGKTTTFKMMTGDIKLSSGDAWINGLNLKTDMKKIYRSIGYCPQFDALLDDLTCKETIIIFGLLRGIKRRECKIVAEKLAYQFDFYKHMEKKVKELSGGNKRKLSTAIALIGNPSIIYLDEPTTGMDPATKRYLWNALCNVRDNGKCIVLTSHSMEECEALCTRLAIMVNGTFKCLGSTQHLKSKFAEGYTLTIKIQKSEHQDSACSELEPIESFVKDHFAGVAVRERHKELITFYITDRSQPWSQMFGIMERGKRILNIEDYSLGQSSLEQVFLTFTKYQRDN